MFINIAYGHRSVHSRSLLFIYWWELLDAPNGPLFNGDKRAQRVSTTESELSLYSHYAEYADGNCPIIADLRAHPSFAQLGVNTRTPIIRYENPTDYRKFVSH